MITTSPALSQLTDLQLFELVKEDKTPAFDELYTRYWAQLVNTAYKRLESRQRAEDLVQDLFVSIYNRRKVLQIETSFSAYVNKALKFSVLNEMRSKMVRDRYLESFQTDGITRNDFSSSIDTRLLQDRIQQTLNILPEKCKKAFVLSRGELRSYKDISLHLNISVSTVEKHIVKALRIMRTNLREFQYS